MTRRLKPSPLHTPLAVACLVVASFNVGAEPQGRKGRPDPLDANAPVPTLQHRSSIKADARLAPEASLAWREANDNVARIGGWRVYLRQAQEPDADAQPAASKQNTVTAVPSPTPAVQPKHQGHGGHHKP